MATATASAGDELLTLKAPLCPENGMWANGKGARLQEALTVDSPMPAA